VRRRHALRDSEELLRTVADTAPLLALGVAWRSPAEPASKYLKLVMSQDSRGRRVFVWRLPRPRTLESGAGIWRRLPLSWWWW